MIRRPTATAITVLMLALATMLGGLVPAASAAKTLDFHQGTKLGGYQTAVLKKNGRIILGLGMAEKSGRYRLCLDDPEGDTVCHRLRFNFVGPEGGNLGFVDWAKRFPHREDGVYDARWYKAGERLGPALSFRKP